MSLPLTRRIAKTVLLTAAGAASVVGTAGAASAAELPTTADVGGLSKVDTGVADDASGTATEGARALTTMSSATPLSKTGSLPEAGASADSNNGRTVEEAAKLTNGTTTGTGRLDKQVPSVQKQLPDVRTQGLPADALGQANAGKTLPVDSAAGKQTPAQRLAADKPVDRTLLPNGLGLVSLGR